MNRDEIKERLGNILMQLESPDDQAKSAALDAYTDLISKESLTSDQKKAIIPFITKIFGKRDSPLRTDCFKVASIIGKKEFHLIEDLYPPLLQELDVKNRYRTEVIIDMHNVLRDSNNPQIVDAIKRIIKDTPTIFSEPYLIPIIEGFWKNSTQKGFYFIDNYMDDLKEAIENYPETFDNLKKIIMDKIKEYDENLKKVKERTAEEERKRIEQIALQEELKKKQEEIREKMRQEQEEMKKSLETQMESITNTKKILQENKGTATETPKTIPDAPPLGESGIEEPEPFTTFSNIGLKRKTIEKEREGEREEE